MRNRCQKTRFEKRSVRSGYCSHTHYKREILLSFLPFIFPKPFIRLSSARSKLSFLIFHMRWRKRQRKRKRVD